MKYDFDTLHPAKGVDAPMWTALAGAGITHPDAISHAVAENKFVLAPFIKEALLDCVEKSSFGYVSPPDDFKSAVVGWMQRRHGWTVNPETMTQTYGVVTALGHAVREFTQPGEGVIVQQPVYPPFMSSVKNNGRELLINRLVRTQTGYEMDFDQLEQLASRPEAKLMLLCSPHNPVGRVWTRQELRRVADICIKHGVLVVSDEIHFDLVLPGYKHTTFAMLGEDAANNCLICTAPSKTFNIPGLSMSNIIIPNLELHRRYAARVGRESGHMMNPFGVAACRAAYLHGEEWLDEQLQYLAENARLFEGFVKERLAPAWSPVLQGTYLAWLDVSSLNLKGEELTRWMVQQAQLAVNDGAGFGEGGAGFIRFNIACPREYMLGALERLEAAWKNW